MSRVRWSLGAVVWLAVIVVIACGAAGLVAALDHSPGTPARAELTAAGDAEVTQLLDAAQANFAALADQVDALGQEARSALAALNASDAAAGEAAITRGNTLVSDVIARTAALRRDLGVVPYVGTPAAGLTISDAIVSRHATLVAALDATDGLDVAWLRLTSGSIAATRMSALLAEHDRLMGLAADRGVHAKYADAIKLIDQAAAQITAARALRDQLAVTVDVTVLDEWLGRNQDYDVALRKLYVEIAKVSKTITPAARAAVKAEAAARARLPGDTRGLVVIIAEIGRGGMNGAVIAIEGTRAKLADALDAGSADSAGVPAPSEGP